MTTTESLALRGLPLTGRVGAQIDGVDLARELGEATIADIRAALLTHKVIFFRGQHDLDPAGHQAFAARFGPLTLAHPTVSPAGREPQVFQLDSAEGARADDWHTDVTFIDRPPTASFLRGVIFPSYGGDTLWANTVAAYDTLPEVLRVMADCARAVHTNTHNDERRNPAMSPAAIRRSQQFASTVFETEHPVVRIHPETGERSLLLGSFARYIVGLSAIESANLINALQRHITSPDNTVRWRWQPGDVAVWDNRATQHYAVADYGSTRRVVQRVTIAGTIPVGIDGRPSHVIKGDASAYSPIGPA